MTLGKATVEKLEAIKDDDKIVEAVGNLTKTRMSAMLVVYRNTIIVHTPKENFRSDYIVTFNTSGSSRTVRWYDYEEHLRVKFRR